MMTSISDYRLSVPPSTADICGDIVPVADRQGRLARLRQEDAYYLNELYNAIRNSSSTWTMSDVSTASGFRIFLHYIFEGLYNIKDPSGSTLARTSTCLVDGTPEFDGPVSDRMSDPFLYWVKEGGYIVGLPSKSLEPDIGGKLDADAVRVLYQCMAQPMFRQSRSRLAGGTCGLFNFDASTTSFDYPTVSRDSSGNPVIGSRSGLFSLTSNGIVLEERQGLGISSIYKRVDGVRMFYNVRAMPANSVNVRITLPFQASSVFAFITDTIYPDTGTSKSKQRLVRLSGSGTDWSVPLLDSATADELFLSIGANPSSFGTWTTSNFVSFCDCQVGALFVKFSNLYFDL